MNDELQDEVHYVIDNILDSLLSEIYEMVCEVTNVELRMAEAKQYIINRVMIWL